MHPNHRPSDYESHDADTERGDSDVSALLGPYRRDADSRVTNALSQIMKPADDAAAALERPS